MKRLQNLLDKIDDELQYTCMQNEGSYAIVNIKFKGGEIEIDYERDDVSVCVFHENGNNSPLLEQYILNNIELDFNEIDRELEEAERHAGVDVAFASIEDYYNYKGY